MLSALLLCALFCACVLLVLRVRKAEAQEYKDPPSYPGSLPIIGISHLLLTDTSKLWHTSKLICAATLQNGGILKTKIGLNTCYFITDPEDALTLANASLEKPYVYAFGECLIGQSLITASASTWKRHRKLFGPAFSLPVIHSFMEIFNNQAKQLRDDLEAFTGQGPFDASSYIKNVVVKTSCLTAFGTVHSEEFFEKYVKGVDDAMLIFTQRFQKFWQHSDLIYKLCGQKKIQDDIINPLRQMTDGIVQKASHAMSNDLTHVSPDNQHSGVKSLLDIFLQIGADKSLTNKEVGEELDGTIVAANESTVLQLETILILLGSHSEIQDRVYEEIIRVIGEDRDVDKADLQKLVYTDAVIKESLRVKPAVPLVGRFIDQDVKLKNYTLRAGTLAVIFIYGINRHSSWGPDAEQFRPERWLEPEGVPNVASAFAAFSLGKRTCIGKTYAITSLKILLVQLLRRYKVKADHTKLKYKLNIILKHAEGHEISLEKRNSS